MTIDYVTCSKCGKRVSNKTGKELVVRAWVECPECMTEGGQSIKDALEEAERKAWKALAGYKFQMFGYHAAVWVTLNRIGQFRRRNPFKELVQLAGRTLKVEGWK